jgi:hypothetical protein
MRGAGAIAIVLILAASVRAEDPSVRGISGGVEFRAPGARIRAKANQALTAPVVVRVAEAVEETAGVVRYRVEYIGTVTGDYDLRDYLERHDGSELALEPLRVHVVSQLDPSHGTDLFATAEAPVLRPTAYGATLVALGVCWVGVPIGYVAWRAAKRRRFVAPPPLPPAPTLADQLRPLVRRAMDGSLSVAERGQLELMLYSHWRGELGLDGPQAAVIPELRSHANAGRLLRAVEGWLHARPAPGGAAGRAEGELASLLEPYRGVPAVGGAAGVPAEVRA